MGIYGNRPYTPTVTPQQQLDQFQRQHGLGQYAKPVAGADWQSPLTQTYGGSGTQYGVPRQQGGLPAPLGGGNIPGSYGTDWGNAGNAQQGSTWGYGTGYQPNPVGQQAYFTGLGGSTPFLSGIQQQLGQMFGQTPGLGFRPQPQTQPMMAPARPTSTYGMGYDGSVPMRSNWSIPQNTSPFAKAAYAAINSRGAL